MSNKPNATTLGDEYSVNSSSFQLLLNDANLNWRNNSLANGDISPRLTFLENQADFIKQLPEIISTNQSTPFPPEELSRIDFSKEVAIGITRGTKPYMGHSLTIVKIVTTKSEVFIHSEINDPTGAVSTAEEFKFTLITMKRNILPSRPFILKLIDEEGKEIMKWEVQK